MQTLNPLNLLYPNSVRYTAYAEQPLSTHKANSASLQYCILSTDHKAVISRQNLVGTSLHSSRNIWMGLEHMMLQLWVTHNFMKKVVREQAGYLLAPQLTPGSWVDI